MVNITHPEAGATMNTGTITIITLADHWVGMAAAHAAAAGSMAEVGSMGAVAVDSTGAEGSTAVAAASMVAVAVAADMVAEEGAEADTVGN